MELSKQFKIRISFLGILLLVFVYYFVNPYESALFPKCPFYIFYGYKCPGCGSQRAIHSLLHFEILKAIESNILLVFSIPYLIIGGVLENSNIKFKNREAWRERLFGLKAIWILFTIILLFWVIRNI